MIISSHCLWYSSFSAEVCLVCCFWGPCSSAWLLKWLRSSLWHIQAGSSRHSASEVLQSHNLLLAEQILMCYLLSLHGGQATLVCSLERVEDHKKFCSPRCFLRFSGFTFPWEGKRKMKELRKACGEAESTSAVWAVPQAWKKLLIGSNRVGNEGNRRRRGVNGYPSRDKRKCTLWLCSVRSWWPSSPVCIQSH